MQLQRLLSRFKTAANLQQTNQSLPQPEFVESKNELDSAEPEQVINFDFQTEDDSTKIKNEDEPSIYDDLADF